MLLALGLMWLLTDVLQMQVPIPMGGICCFPVISTAFWVPINDCQLYRENHEKIELCPVAIYLYFRPGMILLSCFRPRQKLSLETSQENTWITCPPTTSSQRKKVFFRDRGSETIRDSIPIFWTTNHLHISTPRVLTRCRWTMKVLFFRKKDVGCWLNMLYNCLSSPFSWGRFPVWAIYFQCFTYVRQLGTGKYIECWWIQHRNVCGLKTPAYFMLQTATAVTAYLYILSAHTVKQYPHRALRQMRYILI